MRKLEFVVEKELLKTKVDGVVIPNAMLDLATVKRALRANALSPAMKSTLLKQLERKLEDNGPNLSPAEVKVILKRYDEVFHE